MPDLWGPRGIRIGKEGNNHSVGTSHISRLVERGKMSRKKKGRMVPTTYEVYVPPTPPFPPNATTTMTFDLLVVASSQQRLDLMIFSIGKYLTTTLPLETIAIPATMLRSVFSISCLSVAARFVIKAVPDAILSDRAIPYEVTTAEIPNILNVLAVLYVTSSLPWNQESARSPPISNIYASNITYRAAFNESRKGDTIPRFKIAGQETLLERVFNGEESLVRSIEIIALKYCNIVKKCREIIHPDSFQRARLMLKCPEAQKRIIENSPRHKTIERLNYLDSSRNVLLLVALRHVVQQCVHSGTFARQNRTPCPPYTEILTYSDPLDRTSTKGIEYVSRIRNTLSSRDERKNWKNCSVTQLEISQLEKPRVKMRKSAEEHRVSRLMGLGSSELNVNPVTSWNTV
ncbi:hypothetical protein WN51_11399 [Melipona quadrifasciata]|uniref:Uncharacterized protein n=1 Tax=Melipona quadrifasciata TaxID=166423 RepID=A0A0M9ABJ9_9HYME|nr:hypothetical protein WN51_11399 [Melipona quadrifasciata]